MSFRSVNLYRHTESFAEPAHIGKAFLVIGSAAAHVYFHIIVYKFLFIFRKSLNDSLERFRDIREIGYTAADYQHFSLGIFLSRHKIQDSPRVQIREFRRRISRIFAVIGELLREAEIADSIGVYYGSAAAGNHVPDSSFRI